MPKDNSNIDELLNDFSKETEHKAPGNGFETDFEETKAGDFDAAPEPEPPAPPVNEPIHTAGDLLKQDSQLSLETQATLLVGTFDFIQSTILKALHTWKANKKFESKEDAQRIREIIEDIEAGTTNIDAQELPDRAKIRILQRVGKKIADLPFDDAEYNRLEETLRLILKDMPGYQLSPNAGLALAALTVMAPRIADVLID